MVSATRHSLSRNSGLVKIVVNPRVKLMVMVRNHPRRLPATSDSGKSQSRFTKFKQAPVCYNCKNPGHMMSDCWFLKTDKESHKTPVGLTLTE